MVERPDYQQFSQEDFLEDPGFTRWVKHAEDDGFWSAWIRLHPPNIAVFKMAEHELRTILSAERLLPDAGDKDEVWNRITNNIHKAPVVKLFAGRWWMAAAAILIVAMTAFWIFYQGNRTVTVATPYAELKDIVLPDASRVTLNANSFIRYQKSWNSSSPRRVYLEGEAFFDVRHLHQGSGQINPAERFIVQTRRLEVEVLGTTFNIKERRGKTEVALSTGSVQVRLLSDSSKYLLLAPGEVAVYDTATGILKKRSEDPLYHTDWKEMEIRTNNTTVADILTELQDMYGYQIVLEDSSLARRRIDGTIPIRNEQNVVFVLSNILNADIQKINKTLYIKKRK